MLEIYTIVKDHGPVGLMLALLLFISHRVLGESIKLLVEKAKLHFFVKRQASMVMHAFFTEIDTILEVEIRSSMYYPTKPIRQMLFKDLLIVSLTSLREVAATIALEDQRKWTTAQWVYNMRKHLNEINSIYIKKAQDLGIPPIVYERYSEWYFERLHLMNSIIEQIGASDMAPTVEGKTSTVLMMFNLFVVTVMAGCYDTMNTLNGEITGIPYKGGSVEPLHD